MASDAFQDLCLPPAPAPLRLPVRSILPAHSLEDRERGPPFPWPPRRMGCPWPPTACSRPSTNPGSRQAREPNVDFPHLSLPAGWSQSQSIYF